MEEAAKLKAEDIAEGEELKKLAVAYEREKERLENIRLQERLQMMRDNQQQIQDVQKMRKLKEAQEEVSKCAIASCEIRHVTRLYDGW